MSKVFLKCSFILETVREQLLSHFKDEGEPTAHP